MRNLYEMIRSRISDPMGIDVILAAIITITFGNITGEVVSRDYNSYFQASMLLGTLALSFITIRMIAVWVYNYVTSKNK
jgi:hypothetical protein